MTSQPNSPQLTTANIQMMDALSQAERLAYSNRELSAVVYATPRPVSQSIALGHVSPVDLTVLLSDLPAPDGSTVLTTVTRRPCEQPGRQPSLESVVRQVLANLPPGVVLAERAVVEHYPRRPYHSDPPAVFAYQFFSTEGLNVATWIPDTCLDGAMMQPGFEGRGRPWKNGSIEGEATTSIMRYIEESSRSALCRQVIAWWRDAQYETTGERGERNLYSGPPGFVVAAESGSPDSVLAPQVRQWWLEAQHLTTGERGEWNVFDTTPDFVGSAMALEPSAVSEAEPEAARRRTRP